MTNQTQTQYFDLHTTGIGYVYRIREVKPKKGNPFWACDVSALRGSSDSAEYTKFDCRISGEEALHLIRRCENAVEAKKNVLIGFRIGDIYAETFTFMNGEKKGQTGVSMKGRLLYVSFIKVDGELVYKAEKKSQTDEAQAEPVTEKAPADPVAEEAPAEPAETPEVLAA